MKLKIKSLNLFIIPLFIMVIAGCSASQVRNYQDDNNYMGIYDLNELTSYGEWIYLDNYGSVWQPLVTSDWMPFDYGHWAFANGAWTWISYEPFGWIVYHYGNWYDDPSYGWVWIPGSDSWSPANVEWCSFGDYIGWAPLPPRGIHYKNPWDNDDYRFWHVVRSQNFTDENVNNFNVISQIRNETGIRNLSVNRKAPERERIAMDTGRTIPEIKLQNENLKLPERRIKRMNLPDQERTRVEQHAQQIRNKVLISRDEFHRNEQNIRNNRAMRMERNQRNGRNEINRSENRQAKK